MRQERPHHGHLARLARAVQHRLPLCIDGIETSTIFYKKCSDLSFVVEVVKDVLMHFRTIVDEELCDVNMPVATGIDYWCFVKDVFKIDFSTTFDEMLNDLQVSVFSCYLKGG